GRHREHGFPGRRQVRHREGYVGVQAAQDGHPGTLRHGPSSATAPGCSERNARLAGPLPRASRPPGVQGPLPPGEHGQGPVTKERGLRPPGGSGGSFPRASTANQPPKSIFLGIVERPRSPAAGGPSPVSFTDHYAAIPHIRADTDPERRSGRTGSSARPELEESPRPAGRLAAGHAPERP